MSNVINLNTRNALLSVGKILDDAKAADLETVVVVGHTKEGHVYFGATVADGGEVMWLFEKVKFMLLGTAE